MTKDAEDHHYAFVGEGFDRPRMAMTIDAQDWENPIPDFPLETDPVMLLEERERWLERLKFLRGADPKSPGYPDDEAIQRYLMRLVEIQRLDTAPAFREGSWAMPEDLSMGSDARVDFAYLPTMIAVATLALMLQERPDIAVCVPGIERALRKGVRFALGRKLVGHGYDGNAQMLLAIRILALGKVFTLARNDPDAMRVLVRAMPEIETAVEAMANKSPESWLAVDPMERRHALVLLRGGDAEDGLVLPEIYTEWAAAGRERYDEALVKAAAPVIASECAPALIEHARSQLASLREAIGAAELKRAQPVFSRCTEPVRVMAGEAPEECGDVATALRVARGVVDPAPWVPLESADKALERIREALGKAADKVLDAALQRSQVDAEESFEVRLAETHIDERGLLYCRLAAVK
jgi:hypothetical protein